MPRYEIRTPNAPFPIGYRTARTPTEACLKYARDAATDEHGRPAAHETVQAISERLEATLTGPRATTEGE